MIVPHHHHHPIPRASPIISRAALQRGWIKLKPLAAAADGHPIKARNIRPRPSSLIPEGSDQKPKEDLTPPGQAGLKAGLGPIRICAAPGAAVCRVVLPGAEISGGGTGIVFDGYPGIEHSSQFNHHENEHQENG